METKSLTDARPEAARLRAIIGCAVTALCALAEEVQQTDQELADRIWDLTNERLELPVQYEN